jgi:membrane fusion protein, multidrug efflux system
LRYLGRSFVLVALAAAALAGTISCSKSAAGADAAGKGPGGRGGGPVVPVVLGRVTQKDVPIDIAAIGNVEAFSTISVRSQVTGALVDVHFVEGDLVKTGDVLFTIDRRPYEAALQQAEANLTRDQALLKQAEAQLGKDVANSDYVQAGADRQAQLLNRGLISKDQAEQANAAAGASGATLTADRAAIESAKAQLAAQQATVQTARLQLDYTTIKSPINGRTGNLAAKAGNLVTANSTELTTITQVAPIYVTFAMPAVHLQDIKRHLATGDLSVVATPQDSAGQPVTGKLAFMDNAVDAATDTIRLKAQFANDDRGLWPGQFARVSLRIATLEHATVVPTQAVQTGQDGQFVFVVKADSTVEQRTVTTGPAAGDLTVITNGLQPNESIVIEGQLRLEPGTKVTRADPKTGEASPNGAGRGGRGGRGGGRGGNQ